MDEGVGLRQVLDFYVLLKDYHRQAAASLGYLLMSQAELMQKIRACGMSRFASALMYVLHEVFGMEEEKMIAPMNVKEGRFSLDEIMRGGNFGQYDDWLEDKTGEGKLHRYFRMSLRNMRFVKHYPSEAICEPLFLIRLI